MIDIKRAFAHLEDRLQKAAALRPSPKIASVVFGQLLLACDVHRGAALRTVASGLGELQQWLAIRRIKKPWAETGLTAQARKVDDALVAIALQLMNNTIDTLTAARVDEYIELITSLAGSAVSILGGDLLKRCREVADAFADVVEISGLQTRKQRIAHDELKQLETSMQMMLASALLVEAVVGSLTGRFKNDEMTESQRLRAWKEPVVARLSEAREVVANLFKDTDLVRLPIDGYWPAHLR